MLKSIYLASRISNRKKMQRNGAMTQITSGLNLSQSTKKKTFFFYNIMVTNMLLTKYYSKLMNYNSNYLNNK